jgi:hypothetical protein
MTKVTTLQLLDPLKVFLEYDNQYEIYVAQCLQTGHLVTADDTDTAKEMITELLQDEVSMAVQGNNFNDLLSNPAPIESWAKWEMASKVADLDERKIQFHGELPSQLRLLIGPAEVETEIRIATGRTTTAA